MAETLTEKKTKATRATKLVDGAESWAPPPAPASTLDWLTPDSIDVNFKNDREGDGQIGELVESIKLHGILEPLGVVGPDGRQRYQLGYGHRRFAAAKKLKLATVPVMIFPHGTPVEVLRGVENLHRLDLSPMEQAFAIAARVEEAEQAIEREWEGAGRGRQGNLRTEAIRRVAKAYAVSETWVRDRAFLSLHTGKARALVADGRLPITHARELAKIADPALREQLATDAAADGKGGNPQPIDELRRLVGMHQYSLAQVPWKLDVAFAGLGACTTCPHNSKNRAGLFEHQAPMTAAYERHGGSVYKEPEAGVCGFESCFKDKQASTNRTIAAKGQAAARAVRLHGNGGPSVTPAGLGAAGFIPEHVKPSLIVERAKEKLAEPVKPKGEKKAAKPVSFSKAETAEEKARAEWRKASREWASKAMRQLCVEAAKDPALYVALSLMVITDAWSKLCGHRGSKKAAADAGARMLRQVAGMMDNFDRLPDLRVWGKEMLSGDQKTIAHNIENVLFYDTPSSNPDNDAGSWLEPLCEAAGVNCGVPPKLADFLPKPKEPAPKPAKKTGPAKAKKPAESGEDAEEGDGDA